MVDIARGDFAGASFGGGYSDPNASGELSTPDIFGIGGNQGGPLGGGYAGALAPPGAGQMATIGGPAGGPGYDNMGAAIGPMGSVGGMEGALVGGTSVPSYNANNMGGEMPGGMPVGAPGGPDQNPGAGQMPGGMVNGAMAEGGGEPLIRRLQGLTPQQQNYLLSDPNALRAFNQEYDRILQSGQAGSVGVGQQTDSGYQHGQYNVPLRNRHGQYNVPQGGLISQGTTNDFFGGM